MQPISSLEKKQTHSDFSQYLHASCLSPTLSTFTTTIKKNYFTSWPGLIVDLSNIHLPKSIFIAKGHISSENQGLQSTEDVKSDAVHVSSQKILH